MHWAELHNDWADVCNAYRSNPFAYYLWLAANVGGLFTRLLQYIKARVGCIKLPQQEYNFSKPSLTAVSPISPLFR